MFYAYSRISRDPDLDSEAIERQMADNTRLAAELSWEPLTHLVDRNRSAWKKNGSRPAFRELIARIAADECEGVIVWNIDRLLRRSDDLEELIGVIEDHPTPFRSASGDINLSNADGRFQARIMVAVAQKESDNTSRRIRRALEGKDLTRPTYSNKKVLTEICTRLVRGDSAGAIAGDLTSRSIPTPSGRSARWWSNTIEHLIRSDRTLDHLPADLLRDARKALDDRKAARPTHGQTDHEFTLTGIIRCGACGELMYGTRVGADDRYLKYRCAVPKGCGGVSISPAVEVERLVLEDAVDTLEGRDTEQRELPDDSTVRAMISEVEDRYYLRREIDRVDYERLKVTLSDELAAIRLQIESIPVPAPDRFLEQFNAGNLAHKRRLLRRVIESIQILPGVPGPRGLDVARVRIHTAPPPGQSQDEKPWWADLIHRRSKAAG